MTVLSGSSFDEQMNVSLKKIEEAERRI